MKKRRVSLWMLYLLVTLLLSCIYIVYLSKEMTRWGEYGTITANLIIDKDNPQKGILSLLSDEYDGDFYSRRLLSGTLSIAEADGVCLLEVYEGKEIVYAKEYTKGVYDLNVEWEHLIGNENTEIILSSSEFVYDLVLDYSLYYSCSKLNGVLSKYGFYRLIR